MVFSGRFSLTPDFVSGELKKSSRALGIRLYGSYLVSLGKVKPCRLKSSFRCHPTVLFRHCMTVASFDVPRSHKRFSIARKLFGRYHQKEALVKWHDFRDVNACFIYFSSMSFYIFSLLGWTASLTYGFNASYWGHRGKTSAHARVQWAFDRNKLKI